MRAHQVTEPLSHYGTSPVWWSRRHELRFVDSYTGEVLIVGTNPQPPIPTAFARWLAPRAGGGAIVVGKTHWSLSNFDDLGDLAEIDALGDGPDVCFLGAGIDPEGGLWLGLDSNLGGMLTHLDVGSRRPRLSRRRGASGIAFSPDTRTIYLVEPGSGTVHAQSYDPVEGLGPAREFSTDPGTVTGLCVDREGGVWTTRHGKGRVLRHDPDGQLTSTVELDNAFPTGCCFGESGFRTLFITTAAPQPHHERGAVYAIDTGVVGAEPFEFVG